MKNLIWSLITFSFIWGALLLIHGMNVPSSYNMRGTAEMVSGAILFAGGLLSLVLYGKNPRV